MLNILANFWDKAKCQYKKVTLRFLNYYNTIFKNILRSILRFQKAIPLYHNLCLILCKLICVGKYEIDFCFIDIWRGWWIKIRMFYKKYWEKMSEYHEFLECKYLFQLSFCRELIWNFRPEIVTLHWKFNEISVGIYWNYDFSESL